MREVSKRTSWLDKMLVVFVLFAIIATMLFGCQKDGKQSDVETETQVEDAQREDIEDDEDAEPRELDKSLYMDASKDVEERVEALLSMMDRRRALKLFEKGTAKLLASDCHNTDSRPQNLAKGREVLEKKLGPWILDEIDRNAEKLIFG